MTTEVKKELLCSNRKIIAINRLMLCVGIVMVLLLMCVAIYGLCASGITFFTVIYLLLTLLTFIFIVFMILTVRNYEISEDGIYIEGKNVPWNNVRSLIMPFQSRRILLLIYKRKNKRKCATLIANTIKDKRSFFPKTLHYDFQTELEKYIRIKIKQDKRPGIFS